MKKKRINFDIEEQIHREFKSKAVLEGKTMSQKIMEWIRQYLSDSGKKGGGTI